MRVDNDFEEFYIKNSNVYVKNHMLLREINGVKFYLVNYQI